MRIGKLRIQEAKASGLQPRREMHKRDLASVGHTGKFAFGEERRAERETIKTSYELVAVPGFDAVGQSAPMQHRKDVDDGIIDPGFAAIRPRFGATANDLGEFRIDRDLEAVGAHGGRKTPGHMKGVQRQDAAFVGTHP